MITIKDFKKEKTAYIVNMNLGRKEEPSITETVVASVGRTYVTTGIDTVQRRFMNNHNESEYLVEKVSFGDSDLLFASRTAAEEHIEKYFLGLWLGCISTTKANKFTLQQLRDVKKILDPEGVE